MLLVLFCCVIIIMMSYAKQIDLFLTTRYSARLGCKTTVLPYCITSGFPPSSRRLLVLGRTVCRHRMRFLVQRDLRARVHVEAGWRCQSCCLSFLQLHLSVLLVRRNHLMCVHDRLERTNLAPDQKVWIAD